MFKSILVLNFSDENSAIDAQLQLQQQKLFISFNKCFPILKKMAFLCKIYCFWVQKFSEHILFKYHFRIFRRNSAFSALLMTKKGHGLLFTSKKGQSAFLTSKKQQGTFLTSKKMQGTFMLSKKGRVHFWLLKKGQGAEPFEKRKT